MAPEVPAAVEPETPSVLATHPAVPVTDPEPFSMPELSEPILIAALLPSEFPMYAGGTGASLARFGSGVRTLEVSLPVLNVALTEDIAATVAASPRLYWHLSEATESDVVIVLTDRSSALPLLEEHVVGPHRAGFHELDLASRGVLLPMDEPVRWQVALKSSEGGSSDLIAGGAIQRMLPDAVLTSELENAQTASRAHLLAARGYWLDAFAELSAWIVAEPNSAKLRAHRDALLEQVGLGALADGEAESS